MKEELTKVELLQLSEATIDKMKARGYRMLFLMFAIVCALVASVGVARALGIKSADLDTLSSGIMFANSFVVYTGIKNVRRNRIAIETFEEGIAEFKNGEISEEPPTAYKMANDFDLWHLESTAFSWEKQILPFSFFIQSLGIDINNNSGNLVKTIKSFIDNPSIIESTVSTIGKSIYNYVMEQCKKNAGNVYESSFNGIPCLVINSLGNNTYEFQNHPKFSEADLLIRWSFDGKRYNYGIYTCKDEIDVGEICTKYFNGGGHRKSGGGNSDKLLV